MYAEENDFHLDSSLSEKQPVRVAVKAYKYTCTYLSLSFKRESDQFDCKFNRKIILGV